MKILVTGAAGFLGSWLAEELLLRGHTVVGIDNLSGGYKDNLPDGIDFRPGDILNLDVVTGACRGCDLVYHTAALAYEGLSVFSPSAVVRSVVVGSVNVMVAAARAGASRLVNCSSMARYGDNPTPYTESMTPRPVDPYGLAKAAAEQQLNLLGSVHKVLVVHAVPHNVIGPRQKYDDPYRNVASIMANRMLQGSQPYVYGDGSQVRCFSFIQDVIPVLADLGRDNAPHGEVYNVGPDEGAVTVLGLAREIAALLDFRLEPLHLPPRPCEVKTALCSSDKIRHRFGYKTRTGLCEGLASIIEYVRRRGPRPFDYHLPLEIPTADTPQTWSRRLM